MTSKLSDMAKLMGSKGGSTTAKKYKDKMSGWGKKGMASRWAGHVKKTKGMEGGE